jgi:glycosyltransferase involved in cell wall biosynthesis
LHLLGRSTPEQKERILAMVRESGVADRIRVHGFLPRDEMLVLLAGMDIMISIPTMDGMPLSLLESNYVGHWPILSRIPANVEWSGENGASFLDPLDETTFEKCMIEARVRSRDKESLQSLRAKVIAEGDYDTNLRRLRGIYESLLKEAR